MDKGNIEQKTYSENGSCPVGSCGTKGICPGIALFAGWLAGTGLAQTLGLLWLELPLTIIIALLLILGVYPGGGNWVFKRNQKLTKYNK